MKVVVEPHNPAWFEAFRAESERIADALAPNVVAIHHIGSTAIPSICAKPVIDMLIEASALEAVDARTGAVEALGYEAMGEFGIPGRRYFRKNDERGVRRYHVHTFAIGSAEIERHLAFRDFLLAHPEDAERYSALKRELAEAHPHDIDAYMDGKDALIRQIDELAAVWQRRRRLS